MEQLKNYESPEMEIIVVEDIDVITSSPIGGTGSGDIGDFGKPDETDW